MLSFHCVGGTELLYTDEIFRVLDIEPTEDKRSIKRAYAVMAKKFHPEENPQEWQRLHDAYESALAYADRKVASESQALYVRQTPHTTSEEENNLKYEDREQNPILLGGDAAQEIDEENKEAQKVFESWQEERKERKGKEAYWEAYCDVRESLKKLKKHSIQSFRKWQKIMLSPQMRLVRTETLILKDIAGTLERSIISSKTWKFLHNQLEEICLEISGDSSRADEYDRQMILDWLQRSMSQAKRRIDVLIAFFILFSLYTIILIIFIFICVIFGGDVREVLSGTLLAGMFVYMILGAWLIIDLSVPG